jgi:hypothetical protein
VPWVDCWLVLDGLGHRARCWGRRQGPASRNHFTISGLDDAAGGGHIDFRIWSHICIVCSSPATAAELRVKR